MHIHVVARHFARHETVDQVRHVLLGLIKPSRAEPGCLKYELFQSVNDPTDFTFVETFANDEALAIHASAPYIADLGAKMKDLIARPAEVSKYKLIG